MNKLISFVKSKINTFHEFLAKNPAVDASLTLYLGVAVLDWVSSILCWYSGQGHETNPFARNSAMNFVLHKGLTVDAFFLAGFAAIAYTLYKVIATWRQDVANIAVGALFTYQAADRLLSAVIPNFMLAAKMYVADPEPQGLMLSLGRILHNRAHL